MVMPGREQGEIDKLASVDRKVLDLLLIDDFAHHGSRGFGDFTDVLHFDLRLHLPGFEPEIHIARTRRDPGESSWRTSGSPAVLRSPCNRPRQVRRSDIRQPHSQWRSASSPVAALIAVTVASGITAPVVSETRPLDAYW